MSYVVEKMRLAKDKKSIAVNDSLTLAALPEHYAPEPEGLSSGG